MGAQFRRKAVDGQPVAVAFGAGAGGGCAAVSHFPVTMNEARLIELLERVLSCPTAPFHEHHVRDQIVALLGALPAVEVTTDDFGNLIACYRGSGEAVPGLAFGAHMDHPGWVRDPESGEATFLGGVPERYREGGKNPVRWFDDGAFGMWDLPACEIRDGLVHSRACDDLIGCVAMIALFENLQAMNFAGACYAIFTRAEEVGFVGAVELAKHWPLGDGVKFVSLENSSPVGHAQQGKGPVVRVGDRMTVFDDEITGELLEAAKAAQIDVQRCLLDGGSCEATAMQLYGVRAAGISVLLNFYHNCGPGDEIVPESISLADAAGMIDLITALVERTGRSSSAESEPTAREAMKLRIEGRIAEHGKFAEATREKFS